MAQRRALKAEIAERLRLLEEEGLKYCSNCDETKAAEEFAKDKRHTDGLQTYCRECCNLLRRTKYREKIKVTEDAWFDANRKKRNAQCLRNYYGNRVYYIENMKVWRAENVEHRRIYGQQYHEEHKEERNAKDRIRASIWAKENRVRHRENCRRHQLRKKGAGGSHEYEDWLTLLAMCGSRCLDCGTTENITRDHIKPVAWGGTDYLSNIQPLCLSCNCKKQDHYAVDYRPAYVCAWAHFQSYPQLEAPQ